jgi:hypothetical protein
LVSRGKYELQDAQILAEIGTVEPHEAHVLIEGFAGAPRSDTGDRGNEDPHVAQIFATAGTIARHFGHGFWPPKNPPLYSSGIESRLLSRISPTPARRGAYDHFVVVGRDSSLDIN